MGEIKVLQLQEQNWGAVKRTLGGYFAIGVTIVLLVPDKLATSLPGFASAASAFELAVPGIGRISDVSPFPNAMRLFLMVMWLGLPIAAYRVSMECRYIFHPRLFQLRKRDQWFVVGSLWAIAVIPTLFLYFFLETSQANVLAAGGRGGWLVSLMTQYRWGAALIGPLIFCVAAGCLGIALRATIRAASGRSESSELNETRGDKA